MDEGGKQATGCDADELRHVVPPGHDHAATAPGLGDPEQWRAARARLEQQTADAAARLPRPSRLPLVRAILGDILKLLFGGVR